jgi:hypothetical protein
MLATTTSSASSISRAPRPSSLADVLDLILDKGLVVDAYVRISLAGIEVLTIDARVVVASVDTYLRFAEAVNRLDLSQTAQSGMEALTGRSGSNGSSGGEQEGSDEGGGDEGRELERPRASARRRKSDDGGEEGGQAEDEDGDEGDGSRGLIGRLAERAKFER